MRHTVLRLSAVGALALSLAACNTVGERAAGGALLGGAGGAAIGAGVGGAHGAIIGAAVGAGTGAIVGAATTPQPVGPRYVYENVYPPCPNWRARTVRSSSDSFICLDDRGNFRPRQGLLGPRYDYPPAPPPLYYPN